MGMEKGKTAQGLSNPSFQRGFNQTEPARTLPEQGTADHHGQLKKTLLEALRMKAGVTSIATLVQQQANVAYEKAPLLGNCLLMEPFSFRFKRPS